MSNVRDLVKKHGYVYFENGDYNLNLVGICSTASRAGHFDDQLLCTYKVGGEWRCHQWPITTDPGTHYLKNPINTQGAAILCPGQYRSAYRVGTHKDHTALVQVKPVRVWRDNDKDNALDWGHDTGAAGYYGINIHRAASVGITDFNEGSSAGCQVFALAKEHAALMDLCLRAVGHWGNSFTYTLIEE